MIKIKNKLIGVSEKDRKTFDEIQNMFDSSYIEPDQDVLELHPSQASRKSKSATSATDSAALTENHIEDFIQKHVNDWMYQNAPQIIREILNKKIDELKK